MKKIIPIIIFLILSIHISMGQQINWNNETLEIKSLINNHSCENSTSIFKIQRLNYLINESSKTLNYQQIWDNESINITKEIKKFTQTKTGKLTNLTEGKHILYFKINNQTINWTYNLTCNRQININKSLNESIKQNETFRNETTKKNTTIQIENITTSNTTKNQTNESNKNNSTIELINSNNSINQSNNLEQKLNIKINKQIFFVGEKVKFEFLKNNQSITYWIEDSETKIVKKKQTTTNNNEKVYTFKSQEEKTKIYFLKIKSEKENKTIILVVKDNENKMKNSTIKITKAKFYKNKIYLTIEAYRGLTRKTTIYCRTETNNKKSSDELKIKISLQNQKIIITDTLNPTTAWTNETTIICEGLNISTTQTINTTIKNQITKEELANKKETKNFNISKISEQTKTKEKMIANISSIKEKAKNPLIGSVTAINKDFKKEEITTKITIAGLVGVFFGGLIVFGPKNAIDKFIKK